MYQEGSGGVFKDRMGLGNRITPQNPFLLLFSTNPTIQPSIRHPLIIIIVNPMSLSPARFKSALDSEISYRMAAESPSKSDVHFLQRKCQRLDNDLATLQDELSSARLRLRRAEDFEIKYDMVGKQNSNLLSENDLLTKEIQALKVEMERIRLKQEDETLHHKDFTKERASLQTEIDRLKRATKEAHERSEYETKSKGEQNEGLQKKEIDKMRREFQDREERLENEVRQLKKVIAEKQTVQNVIGLKVDRIRKEKEEEIGRLSQAVQNQRKDFEAASTEKREEIESLQAKFDKMINYQLENIKLNQDNQDEIFSTQVNGLKEMITIKNDEIAKLLTLLKSNSDQTEKEKDQLKREISKLKEQIYKLERENEIELYNTMERLTKIHAVDIQELEEKYRKLLEAMDNDKKDMEKLLKEKDEELAAELRELERVRKDFDSKIKDREMRIAELMQRLKNVGASNINEIKYLHESFHKIEEEKESMATGYQENISFMDQQIKKLTASIQLKQITIRTLEEQLASIKKLAADQQKELLEKWKNERKERQQQKEKDREEREGMDEEHRQKEKDWKAKERQLEKEKEREEREKNRINFVLEETEKDNSRLNGYIRQLDDALKRELKKNQLSTLDTGGARREMVNELQRQKSELEAIKRMEVDQITKTFEIEVTKLTNHNQKLQTDLLQRSIAVETLEGELKKIENTNRNIEKINKEKMLEYQRKMATLNSEINLTQNLYQNFLQAKSRTKRSSD